MLGGEPNRFVTITIRHQEGANPYEQALRLSDAWRAFVRHYRKKHGKTSLEYIAVFEAHKSGAPHLHILCRSTWIAQTQLKEFMMARIDSHRQDVRWCKDRMDAAYYCAKYVGKGPGKFGTCKRYWQSTTYKTRPWTNPHPETDPDVPWNIRHKSPTEIFKVYEPWLDYFYCDGDGYTMYLGQDPPVYTRCVVQ